MKGIIRIFLHDLGGNPNKETRLGETALHLVCEAADCRLSPVLDAQLRADCLQLLLAWKGPELDGAEAEPETPSLTARDAAFALHFTLASPTQSLFASGRGYTALHKAAGSGLRRCVELLVAAGAEVGAENAAKETACDVAEREGHTAIAQFLEAKTLFSVRPRLCPSGLHLSQINGHCTDGNCGSGERGGIHHPCCGGTQSCFIGQIHGSRVG